MNKVFLGIKGHVVCLNKDTGKELWRTKLKIDWGKPTPVVYSEKVFAYVSGELFCLAPETGEILWKNALSGLGHGVCTMSIAGKTATLDGDATSESAVSEVLDSVIDIVT